MIKASVITDEVSQSLQEVLAFARRHALDGVELRSIEGMGAFDFDTRQVRSLASAFRGEGLAVCCLSLPLYKCGLDDVGARAEHEDKLKRAIEHAQLLGCSLLRGFCFWREPDLPLPLAGIAEAYHAVIPLLEGTGIRIVLEADPSVYGHTARDLLAIVRAIDSPAVRVLFDGGNLLFAPEGESPGDACRLLWPYIAHVHMKDAIRAGQAAQAVRIGTGEAQIREQLALLQAYGYDGFMSLETHYRLTKEIDDALMRLPGGYAFSDGALEASEESMAALLSLYKEVGDHAEN